MSEFVIINLRIPRTIMAFIVGSSLALTGSTYQGIFKNPLVSPDLLGVSADTCVGAAIAILNDCQDLLNAATVLRTLYENIIYIIATSYDKEIKTTLDTSPGELRKVLVENCSSIFTDYFEPDDLNNIYKYLCKIIHPCSLKELVSYMNKTIKYKNYLLGNLKYMMLVIEYMYLNFLNKK